VSKTYHVVARRELTGPLPPVARAIAKVTGQIVHDVIRELRDQIGFLVSGVDKVRADAIIGALSMVGVPAFRLADDEIVQFPEPTFLETAQFGDDALMVSDLRNQENQRLGKVIVPYKDVVLLAVACVRTEGKRKVIEDTHFAMGDHPIGLLGRLGDFGRLRRSSLEQLIDPGTAPKVRTEITSKYDHLLDIFAVEPAHRLRLNASTFNFVQTGLEMQPTSIANLAQFVERLGARCEEAAIDPGVRFILDGNPQTNLRFVGLERYETYLLWRTQLLYHPE